MKNLLNVSKYSIKQNYSLFCPVNLSQKLVFDMANNINAIIKMLKENIYDCIQEF